MNRLLMAIISASIFSALLESVLPDGGIKKPAVGAIVLLTLLMIFAPFADVFLKAKENSLFKDGGVFVEKREN